MGIAHLVETSVPTIQSQSLVRHAIEIIKHYDVEGIPVLEGEKYMGMVYARKLLGAELDEPVAMHIIADHVTVTEEITLQAFPGLSERYVPIVEAGIYKGCMDRKHLFALIRDQFQQQQSVIDQSYDGILIADAQGYILYINKALEQMTMLKKTELEGMHMTDLVSKGLFRNESVVMKTLQTGKSYTNVQSYKNTGLDTLVTAAPVHDEHGELKFVLANVRDISELTRLQKQLEKSQEITNRYQTELKQLRFENMKSTGKLIAYSQEMDDVLDLVYHVASSDSTVLLLGESGVGKEVMAKILHENSSRVETGTFMKVNCGAIPPNLLESELFGYDQGAFTGAKKGGKPGIFELAHNGTLFLDEIGELPLDMQVKLLRVLQEQEIMRVGGVTPVKINVRIIAATNRDLEEMIRQGTFRQDLYYRLNVVPIKIPPIRERKADIVPLLGHFLKFFNEKYHYSKKFSSEAVDQLMMYGFPGNVRELSNLVERLVLTCREDIMDVHHLPSNVVQDISQTESRLKVAEPRAEEDILMLGWDDPLQEENRFEQLEKEALVKALKRYGSVRKTGKAMGVSHTTVLKKMKKFGLTAGQIP
ncbi:sigma 54-interacting transcriptional regulator [Ammoniphilus sp. CFH 90114]|uniref:sigma 54-interacting transcriptional regulator n=1 Tax=Ammoniphilus sp. CFH 90114 TaxID=2493665 RepID=UPI00100EEF1A|nr:sigma 54-interacting transcriptional regulator [Ammoniphilus sp. CFH 90114]RXT13692.1 PAS domain-containing protein [Ammoniphilus sp. CFH 90114]